jgi:hypothetical protein
MATRTDFIDEEWDTLHRGLTGAGMWVAVSERGFSSTFKETGAMAGFLAHQARESSSQLCRELAAVKGTGWKVSSSPEELRQGTLQALQASVAVLESKSAQDLDDYRELVLALARRVSEAGRGGDDVEANVIAELTAAMGL